MTSLTHDDYIIAWICALPLEAAAARAMMTKTHEPLPIPPSDTNAYTLGEVNGHHTVITCLPAGVIGKVSAATVVSRMRSTFPRLQYGLMVGVGGGVPGKNNDIRLGDVVVSKPVGNYSGVIQYDYGKTVQGGRFELTGTLNKPPQTLLTHMGQLEAKEMTEGKNTLDHIVLDALERHPNMRERFSRPERETDLLFHPSYHHAAKGDTCDNCARDKLVKRQPREMRSPNIHYGLIASGDQVMKDSETRDLLAEQHGILCFEMEAAGLMDGLPSLVIRGICDYCDSHKQKEWQGYAALVAAAYAKLLLSIVPVSGTNSDSMRKDSVRHWMVPLARNPRFVGRAEEIKKLERLINMRDGPQRVAITGLGGVGKTQVALETAYRIRDREECSVFWIPCTSKEMIDQTYLNLAQKLGLRKIEHVDIKDQVKIFLESEHASKWLLIFDNADDMDMWLPAKGDSTPGLEAHLPQSENGRILFTSRNRKLAVDLTVSNIIPIPDVDKDAALQILERSIVQQDLLKDHVITNDLLEQLCFLPLAITQASAYINSNGLSLTAYLDLLQEQESEVVDLLSEDFQDAGRYKDITNPVITTWLISFKQIQQSDQLAFDYLSFMCCLNPRNIPSSILPMPKPTTRKRQVDALGLLNAYCFINGQDRSINMHRLVHIATRNWLRQNKLFGYWINQVADHLQEVFPTGHHKNRTRWREYLPHVLALVHEQEFHMQQERYIELMWRIAFCLANDERHRQAGVLHGEIMKIRHKINGADHPSTLASMQELGVAYANQGLWDKAEKITLHAMKSRNRILGSTDPNTLTSMRILAMIYEQQGRFKEAERLNIKVIHMMKESRHCDTLKIMMHQAAFYEKQGRGIEAEELHIQIKKEFETELGLEGPLTPEKIEKLRGPEDPDTLISMGYLAATYLSQDRWDEAEQFLKKMVDIRKVMLGAEHPVTLKHMEDVAAIYMDLKKWDKAEKLLMETIEMQKIVMGAEHPDTLIAMSNLAQTLKWQGKTGDAIALMKECRDLLQKVLGSDHPKARASSRLLSDWVKEYESPVIQTSLSQNNLGN